MLEPVAWMTAALAGLLAMHWVQKRCFPYLWKDSLFLLKVIRYGLKLESYKRSRRVVTVLDTFVRRAERMPSKAFVIYEGVTYTYGDVNRRSDQVAQVFERLGGVKKGDTVALLMNNEPDFVCLWLGLGKLGCVVSFLNTNIKARSLLQCFNCCPAKVLIVGADLLDVLEDILPTLQKDSISVWVMKAESRLPGVKTLLDKVQQAPARPVPPERRAVTSLRTTTLYIYTSGTTGLPKAAVITHMQALKASGGLWVFGGRPDDVVYIPLPLYHSAASLIGIGGTIEIGATCVLKKRFSASQFWNDCREHNVTIFQYIGEICRYLCNQPKSENDRQHRVHMAVGNGLRQDVWREFHRRFGEIRMCEFYGSTEGNLCFMNHLGKIGAVGRSNFFYKRIFKYVVVKYDMVKDEPVRNQRGFCEPVAKGETGLLLCKVNSQSPFFGYAGTKQHAQKKVLRDVMVKGDVFFNTGDLMVEDQEDFICFKDRIGDSFRWKGENVATTEVAEILGLLDFIQEANVYGVEVPGNEGRAGMAAVIIRPGNRFDGKNLFDHVLHHLPRYAQPVFIRIQESMELTGTYKQQKLNLVDSGFSPSTIKDPLYFLDNAEKSYVELTNAVFQRIVSGQQKL